MNAINITKRNELTTLIDALNLKTGVEVGVHKGNFSEHLLGNSKLNRLYSVDAWSEDEALTQSARKKCERIDNKMDACYQETIDRLKRFGERSIVIKDLSVNAAKKFENNSLDFIYLDASHRFTGFTLDIVYWWDKLKWGGILSGHDYWRRYRYEVAYVVNGFCMEHKQLFYLTTEERQFPLYGPSWFLIKTQRTKEQFAKDFEEHKETLIKQQKLLKENKKITADIPYECQ